MADYPVPVRARWTCGRASKVVALGGLLSARSASRAALEVAHEAAAEQDAENLARPDRR